MLQLFPLQFGVRVKKAVKISSPSLRSRCIRKSASLLHLLLAFPSVNISIDCKKGREMKRRQLAEDTKVALK